jgi:hypothetical protein
MKMFAVFARVAGAVAALVLPPSAMSQPAPEDSVTGSGANLLFSIIQVDARSEASGANPRGQVFLQTSAGFGGPVTCLAVTGNRALIGFRDPIVGDILALAIDNRPPGATDLPPDEFYAAPQTGGCTPSISGTGGQLLEGDIDVTDAQPFPMRTDQCKNGGWQTYGIFKNQGDCVSFVATGGKNPPRGP